nr:pilus assembly protein PilM [Lachnospiraceae bacterium]
MANRVVSIDIGSVFTRIAEVDYKKKNPGVYSCFSIRNPEGSVEDGQIMDALVFADELKKGLAENGIRTKKAVFSITSTKIANREVTVPKVKEKSLGPLVSAKASEYFPVDMSQYQLAYNTLEEIEADGRKQLRMLMLAAPKDLLESYYTLAKEAGLTIDALDYSGNSILPVLKAEVTDDVTLIIKVDENTSLLTV